MLKRNQNVLKSLQIASVRQQFGDGSEVLCSAQRSSQHLRSPQINTTFQVKHKQKKIHLLKKISISHKSATEHNVVIIIVLFKKKLGKMSLSDDNYTKYKVFRQLA